MSKVIVYDKAKYHYEGDYPAGLPIKQAFVHSGMFLGWIIDRDLYSEDFKKTAGRLIQAFKGREMTGPAVFEQMDGAFTNEDLNEEGNAFAQYYFDFERGSYLTDYEQLLAANLPSFYHVQDSWENYERLKQIISQQYDEWRRGRSIPGSRGTR